jgi:hypothetical protein
MKLGKKVMKFADDYPLAVLALGTVGIMYAFENVGQINGLGQATFKTSGNNMDNLFRKTGHTGAVNATGTGRWDTVMPSPSGPQVRYDAEYHSQPLMMDPELEKTLAERGRRPVVQSASIRHGYEPVIFAGMRHTL